MYASIDHALVSFLDILKTKGHNIIEIQPSRCDEGRVCRVRWKHHNLIITRVSVDQFFCIDQYVQTKLGLYYQRLNKVPDNSAKNLFDQNVMKIMFVFFL